MQIFKLMPASLTEWSKGDNFMTFMYHGCLGFLFSLFIFLILFFKQIWNLKCLFFPYDVMRLRNWKVPFENCHVELITCCNDLFIFLFLFIINIFFLYLILQLCENNLIDGKSCVSLCFTLYNVFWINTWM